MSEQVEVAKEETKIEQIIAKLFAGAVNGIPVVNGNDSVIGIVTAIDVLKGHTRRQESKCYDGKRHNDTQPIRNKERYTNK